MDIILTSALCKDVYPDNQGGDFRNLLNKPLVFTEPGEEWSVALSEISYIPDSWYNVRENHNTIGIEMSNFLVYGYKPRLVWVREIGANKNYMIRRHDGVDIEFPVHHSYEWGWRYMNAHK